MTFILQYRPDTNLGRRFPLTRYPWRGPGLPDPRAGRRDPRTLRQRRAHRSHREGGLMAVSKRTRYEVLKRDNHTCRYCGGTAPDVVITVDHVTPIALGGGDDPSNLVAACRDCNAGKASTSPDAGVVEDVAQDALRWAAAIRLAGQHAEQRQAVSEQYVWAFFDEMASYWPDQGRAWRRLLPDDWEQSIALFYRRGLPQPVLFRALATTFSRGKLIGEGAFFRYLCGICWKALSEIEDDAARIVRMGDVD